MHYQLCDSSAISCVVLHTRAALPHCLRPQTTVERGKKTRSSHTVFVWLVCIECAEKWPTIEAANQIDLSAWRRPISIEHMHTKNDASMLSLDFIVIRWILVWLDYEPLTH